MSLFREANVCILGDESVGKTYFINQTLKKTYSTDTTDFQYYFTQFDNNIKFNIWEMQYSLICRSLVPVSWHHANVIILLYDITNSDSFKSLKEIIQQIPMDIYHSSFILLIGNKSDLKEKRVIQPMEVSSFAYQNDITHYYEVSALSGEGIDDVWNSIANASEILELPLLLSHEPFLPDQPPQTGFISNISEYMYRIYKYIKSFF